MNVHSHQGRPALEVGRTTTRSGAEVLILEVPTPREIREFDAATEQAQQHIAEVLRQGFNDAIFGTGPR